MNDFKRRIVRAGFAKACSQSSNFLIRMGSLMVLGRLLDPKDFGLVGMVTAVFGILNMFKDFGLSTASIQRPSITHEQLSALFWINILVGAILTALTASAAPFVAGFYHEPRLVGVTLVVACGFLLNAAGVQHAAILQRQMRFSAAAAIEIFSLIASTTTGIAMAATGHGYWALVTMAVTVPAVSSASFWWATKWVPGKPRRNSGVLPMLRFGGTLTLNGIVVYVGYNLEKVLLGRYWGAEVVGIYGRAFQLINIPTDNLNFAAGTVVFAALSRLQDDPLRLKKYFLKGYSLVLGLTLPIALICAMFADDIIFVLLGPKWKNAAVLFRLLAPTIMCFGLINPLGWLLNALGQVGKSLRIALVISPLVISGYLFGLPYGAKGVAFAYSAVMASWLVPHLLWCIHGTAISFGELVRVLGRPLGSALLAGLLSFGLRLFPIQSLSPLLRLALECALFGGFYIFILLFVMGQKSLYMGIFRELRKPAASEAWVTA
jgi:PST family polysaccharide transporter